MSKKFTFTVYGVDDAEPLSGLADTLTWWTYKNAITGSNLSQPSFTELGTSGQYQTNVDTSSTGIVDCGDTSGALSRFVFMPAATLFVFPAYSADTGLPVSTLSLSYDSWDSLFDTATGLSILAPEFGFTNIGDGLYRGEGPLPVTSVGRVDLTSACNPIYQVKDLALDDTGPGPVVVLPAPTVQYRRSPAVPRVVVTPDPIPGFDESFAEDLIESFGAEYKVTRRGAATFQHGIAVPASARPFETFCITASVQPASGHVLLRLPEGRRETATVRVLTTDYLQVGGQGVAYEADLIDLEGIAWEVQDVKKWPGHYDVLAQRPATSKR